RFSRDWSSDVCSSDLSHFFSFCRDRVFHLEALLRSASSRARASSRVVGAADSWPCPLLAGWLFWFSTGGVFSSGMRSSHFGVRPAHHFGSSACAKWCYFFSFSFRETFPELP